MKPYIGIVHKDEGTAYGITFPDAPGCFSAADETDNVFVMAREALSGWAQSMHESGLAAPVTRDLSDIKIDPEWAGSFESAVLVIAVEFFGVPERVQEAA